MSDTTLFADDTSLFHVVTDAEVFADVLNHDFKTSKNCECQWKRTFNPDPTSKPSKSFFSKSIKAVNTPIYFNKSTVVTVLHHKHTVLVLDEPLLSQNMSKKLLFILEEA